MNTRRWWLEGTGTHISLVVEYGEPPCPIEPPARDADWLAPIAVGINPPIGSAVSWVETVTTMRDTRKRPKRRRRVTKPSHEQLQLPLEASP